MDKHFSVVHDIIVLTETEVAPIARAEVNSLDQLQASGRDKHASTEAHPEHITAHAAHFVWYAVGWHVVFDENVEVCVCVGRRVQTQVSVNVV